MVRAGRILAAAVLAFFIAPSSMARDDPLELGATILRQESGVEPRPFSTRDFGREEYPEAVSVLVPEQESAALLQAVRAKLPSGLVAFVGTTRSLADPPAEGDEVVIGPGANQFDILRIAATDAVNYGKETDELIAVLEAWDRRYGIDILGAETDTIQLKLKSLPKDVLAFAREIYEFCPDTVDQGTGTIEELAADIEKSHEVSLWWD